MICQGDTILIREESKAKRLEWQSEREDLDFADMICNECTVQLESHHRISYKKREAPPKYEGWPKHQGI